MDVDGFLLILVASCLVVSARGNKYFVVAPNMFRLEHPETVMVSVFGNQKTVTVWLSHMEHKFSEHTVTVSEVAPQIVEMRVREEDIMLADKVAKPGSIFLNAQCNGYLRQKKVLLQYKSGYCFVQTSQPIYTPMNTVKIRYLALTEDMKDVGNKVNVTLDIISPSGKKFSRSHKTNPGDKQYTGVFHRYNFDLSPACELGIWKAKVYYRGLYQTEETAFFEVREYVLPTYDVDVQMDKETILPETKHIMATVTAKYVYRKPVIGRADLKVYLLEDSDQTEILALPPKQLSSEDGIAEFDIDIEELREELKRIGKWFPANQRLKVKSVVTEGATLNKETGIHDSVVFSNYPFKFSCRRSKRFFRPLRKYYLKCDVTSPNGNPAAGVMVQAGKIKQDQFVEAEDGETDANGQVTLIFSVDNVAMVFRVYDMDHRSVSEDMVIEPYAGVNQIQAEYVITLSIGTRGLPFSLSLHLDDFSDGEHVLRADNNMQWHDHGDVYTGMTSMIVTRGKIVDAYWDQVSNQIVKPLTDDLQEKSSPGGRFIVFYCDLRTGEVVADAIKVSVTPRCKGEGIRLDAKTQVLPGDTDDLTIFGQPGTVVGLSAVDKAVLLLNNKNVLHKNKLFEELESHDMGCGYGGGRDSANVFENAGLTVITDATMNTGLRASTDCKEGQRKKRDAPESCKCCVEGEKYAMSLFESTNSKKPKVDTVQCYSRLRTLIREHPKLGMKCIREFYDACNTYVRYENEADVPISKSGDSDYLDDLSQIKFEEKNVYVRRVFKESFKFEHYTIGENSGQIKVNTKYPDSITTWIFQAIGLTPDNGVCISDPFNITAFREFFIQLDLPYQARRLEHIDIKATIFFYGDGGSNAAVSVYLDGQKGMCSDAKPEKKSRAIRFEMVPNSAHTVRYPIIPLVARQFPIKVSAVLIKKGKGFQDAIEKKLYVVNEGKGALKELSVCLDPMNQLEHCHASDGITVSYQGGETPTQTIIVDLTLPADMITGTATGTAYIYSNNAMENVVQAVVIQGTEKFITLPRGCVEQTIIGLAPLIYAMRYLKVTKQVTDDIEERGNENIRKGVLHEFSWIKTDGSYPAYGGWNVDSNTLVSSTWLTAYIAKVFCQAKHVVDDSVDEELHIVPTINWLTSHQNDDGSFTEHNRVTHSSLMGLSIDGNPALAAFILIALQECKSRSTNVENAVQNTLGFLEQMDLNTLKTDPYALAIVSYALAISDSALKRTFNDALKEVKDSPDDGGMMYWGWNGVGAASAKSIEASSYALLAQLKLDDLKASSEIAEFLQQHRTSGGAFSSTQRVLKEISMENCSALSKEPLCIFGFLETVLPGASQLIDAVGHFIFKTIPQCYSWVCCAYNQGHGIERFVWKDARHTKLLVCHKEKVISCGEDTVIGLQALCEFNLRQGKAHVDMTVKLMAEEWPEQMFQLNNENALVQKAVPNLPVETAHNELRVEVTGQGSGILNIDLRYNINKTEIEKCAFEINMDSIEIHEDPTEILIGKEKGCACGVCGPENAEAAREAMVEAFGEEEEDEVESNFGRKKRSGEDDGQTPVKLYCSTLTVRPKVDTSGMTTIQVWLQTGITVKEDDLKDLIDVEQISLYEMPSPGNSFFNLYIDQMNAGEEYKYAFTLEDTMTDEITNRRVVPIHVVDYYNPVVECQALYGVGNKNELDFSATCQDKACKCLSNTCPEPWKKKLLAKSKPAKFLIIRTCDRHYANYAVQVQIISQVEDIDKKEITAVGRVEQVYNQGSERVAEGSNMNFAWRMDCKWPELENNKKYYIIAKDGIAYRDDNGEKKFKYYMSEDDIILKWKPRNTPVGRFMKAYEKYWKTRQCPK